MGLHDVSGLKRYTKQRGSLLWIAGTTGNTVSGINKWPLFTPAPWPEFTPALTALVGNDVMLRTEGELGDIFRTLFANNQDVVFPIAAGAGVAFRDHDHRFHGDDHTRQKHGLDVLAQFHARFPAVVMAKHAKRMAVTKGTILKQAVATIEIVQFRGDITAFRAWYYQLQPPAVNRTVYFP